MKSPLQIVTVVALMIAAWVIGFFETGKPLVRTGSTERGTTSGVRSALGSETGGASSFDGGATANERRGRVMSDLLSAMQQHEYQRRFLRLSEAVAKIGPDDIDAVLDLVKRQSAEVRRDTLPQVVARWAEFDPKSAAAFALTLNLPSDPRAHMSSAARDNLTYFAPWNPTGTGAPLGADQALALAASEWARNDPAAAKAWALDLPSGRRQRLALAGIATGIIAPDPAGALAWMQSLPEEKRTDGLHSVVFQVWAESDPQSASQQALALPLGGAREKSLLSVAETRSRRDPKSAYEWIQQIPDARTRNLAAVSALSEWAKTDPDAAMNEASRLQGGTVRADAQIGVIKAVAIGDSDRAVELAQQFPDSQARNRGIASLVRDRQLYQLTPKAAVTLATMLPQGPERTSCIELTLDDFAEESPKLALEIWKTDLSSAAYSEKKLSSLLSRCASRDPQATVEWIMKQPDVGETALLGAMNGWAFRDTKAALAWADALPEGSRKTAAIAGTIHHLAYSDPAGAAEKLKALSPGNAKNEVGRRVAFEWVKSNPAEAEQWAGTIADSALKTAVVSSLARELARFDLPRASALLETLPPGSGRDDAAMDLIPSFAFRDPAAAAKFAERIGDNAKRERSLIQVFNRWSDADEAAAKGWLRTVTGLSPKLRDELLAK